VGPGSGTGGPDPAANLITPLREINAYAAGGVKAMGPLQVLWEGVPRQLPVVPLCRLFRPSSLLECVLR
jgi:hypothetical protein